MTDFTWFDRLLKGVHTLRVVFARGLSWQDVLVVGFGLDPTTATSETLDDQLSHPDDDTVRAGERDGWGYTVQTTIDLHDNPKQLERLSSRGEAFALAFTLMTDAFECASDGSIWGFQMTLPLMSPPHPQFAAAMEAAGFMEDLPNPRIVGPRFVQLAFGITITPAMIEGALHRVVRPPQPPPPPRPMPQPVGIPRLPEPPSPPPKPATPQPPTSW